MTHSIDFAPPPKRKKSRWKHHTPHTIDDQTGSVGIGCVAIDCEMARKHGYTNRQLERLFNAVTSLARKETGIAKRRHPDFYFTTPDKVDVFVGDLSEKDKRKIINCYKGK